MKIHRPHSKKPRIEIIPMIDVIFFLLVFFMVSSISMTKINSIPVALPKTSSSAQSLRQKVILSVKKSGEIFVNKNQVSMEGIGTALALVMKDNPQDTVLVNADENANYGYVLKAIDQARAIGIHKFALATQPAS